MKNKNLIIEYYTDPNGQKQVVNKFKSEIVEQNGYYFAHFSNERIKGQHAFIINQDDVKQFDSLYEKEFLFEAITMTRVKASGYDNQHVIRHGSIFNHMGTNGNVDNLKDLIDCDYLPQVVRLIGKIELVKVS